jgi:hypothetical protein
MKIYDDEDGERTLMKEKNHKDFLERRMLRRVHV